jgi:hypothetical protein
VKISASDKISLISLVLSVICFVYVFKKDVTDNRNKYKVEIRDVATDRFDKVQINEYGADTSWYSLVIKKMLITNEGTQPLSFLGAYYYKGWEKSPFVLNQDTLFLYSLYFFSDTDHIFNITSDKVYDLKNFQKYFVNSFNIRIEPGEGKFVYLAYLNSREKAFAMIGNRKSNPDYTDEFSSEIEFKFSNQLSEKRKIYIERRWLEDFGGAESSF